MPSLKKRVQSQRTPQKERPTVTPYESQYDEKYSSDEEIKYEVDEPDDSFESSNMSVHVSEKIHSTKSIEDTFKNQAQKFEDSQEKLVTIKKEEYKIGNFKNLDIKNEGKKDVKKNENFTQEAVKVSDSSRLLDNIVFETQNSNFLEEIDSKKKEKLQENEKKIFIEQDFMNAAIPAMNQITKPTSEEKDKQGETKIVIKQMQSTIGEPTDQITSLPVTNKDDLSEQNKHVKSVTKQIQDINKNATILSSDILNDCCSLNRKFSDSATTIIKTSAKEMNAFESPNLKPSNISEVDEKFYVIKDQDKNISNEKEFPEQVTKTEQLEQETSVLLKNSNNSKSLKPLDIISTSNISEINTFFSDTNLQKKIDATLAAEKLMHGIDKSVKEFFSKNVASNLEKFKEFEETNFFIKTNNEKTQQHLNTTEAKNEKKVFDNFVTDELIEEKITMPVKRHIFNTANIVGRNDTDGNTIVFKNNDKKEESQVISSNDKNKKTASNFTEKIKGSISETIILSPNEKEIRDNEKITKNIKTIEFEEDFKKEKTLDKKEREKIVDTSKKVNETVGASVIENTGKETVINKLIKDVEKVPEKENIEPKSQELSNQKKFENVKEINTYSNILGGDSSKLETSNLSSTNVLDSCGENFITVPKENINEKVKTVEVVERSDLEKTIPSLPDDIEFKDISGESSDIFAKQLDSPSKPRVIFRIESEDELTSDIEGDWHSRSELASPTHEFGEKLKQELKEKFEKEQMKLEERLLRGGIFDISHESLSRTKELVDQRLRKISEIKPATDSEEQNNKKDENSEKTETREEIKIGRFHITPALVEEVMNKSKENEIVEKLKSGRLEETEKEEVEKELSEKLTEADFEEVIRELKLEGLKAEVYFQPEEIEKDKKKERTLKRVERRFEKMASETLEQEKEEADRVSEEKLDEKREAEFQRVLSQLSSEEVAESQQEYLQIWEEGGLSSLTPTDDWESRDPDTPENELDEDSPKNPESFGGSHGTGKFGEPTKIPELKNHFHSKKSPSLPCNTDNNNKDILPNVSCQTPLKSVEVESTLFHVDQSPTLQKNECVSTYDDKRKFWEEMSLSQNKELKQTKAEKFFKIEGFDSETKTVEIEKQETKFVNNLPQKMEKNHELFQKPKSSRETENLKTDSFEKLSHKKNSKKPFITQLQQSFDTEEPSENDIIKIAHVKDSPATVKVSELVIKTKTKSEGVPITETNVIFGSTILENQVSNIEIDQLGKNPVDEKREEMYKNIDPKSDSATLHVAQYKANDNISFSNENDFNFSLGEGKKNFEEKSEEQLVLSPHPRQLRSLSLPAEEICNSVKAKKRYFEEEMKTEIIIESLMNQISKNESDTVPDISDKVEEIKIPNKEHTKLVTPNEDLDFSLLKENKQELKKCLRTNKFHMEKSETEGSEKKKEQIKTIEKEELVPFITVTASKQFNTGPSNREVTEDTQSESDVTPEDAKVDSIDTVLSKSRCTRIGLPPNNNLDYVRVMAEGGIGRWIGQEDLSKEIWEKDDDDVSQYKVEIKWERTRSEGASPKDRYVCTPEEHYPDTVWEVPIQEQLEDEEVTLDIPIEKQVIIEKDEEEQEEKEKLTEEEAKKIANEILKYIQTELCNRATSTIWDSIQKINNSSAPIMSPTQITKYYLRHLAGEKNFCEQDVYLIKNALKDQQEQDSNKFENESMNIMIDIMSEEKITEEPSTAADNFTKIKTKNLEEIPTQFLKEKELKKLSDVDIVDQTIAEVKESLEAAQEQLIEQHKKRMKTEIFKKESPSEFEFKDIRCEKNVFDTIKEQIIDQEPKNEINQEFIQKNYEKSKEKNIPGKLEDVKKEKVNKIFETEENNKIIDSNSAITNVIKEISESESNLKIQSLGKKKIDNYSSEDSPRSISFEEYVKSPPTQEETLLSRSSAERVSDSKSGKSEKSEVVLRHSENSYLTKVDRRSGTDLEPYSSSGESHYHSLEQSLSRPCSSDVEGFLVSNFGTAGSSEYESALSNVTSGKHATISDYKTAISSLSSRESIKSLDSESSGHLASVEVSSEGSETLIPSALELDKDIETSDTAMFDDNNFKTSKSKNIEGLPHFVTLQKLVPALPIKQLGEDDFEMISESEVVSWAGEVSEDEEGVIVAEEEVDEKQSQKMKRSYEMTFQPEPQPVAFCESHHYLSKDNLQEKPPIEVSMEENTNITAMPEERFGTSLDDTGSILSTSLSTTSETSVIKTVIELSRTDSEKMDCSMTVSASSIDSVNREDYDISNSSMQQSITNEMSTSTTMSGMNKKNASVTITTSTSEENGLTNVSTQVTSISRKSSTVEEETKSGTIQDENILQLNGSTKVEYDATYDELNTEKAKIPQGQSRKENTKNFNLWYIDENKQHKIKTEISAKDKKFYKDVFLTEKEVKNDEKKEADDSEKLEETLNKTEKCTAEKMKSESKEIEELDEPKYQASKLNDEESSIFETSFFNETASSFEPIKQDFFEIEKENTVERSFTPEPEEMENKDITPEFSSEAQASVTELEQEYSSAYSRRDEYACHASPIREEGTDLDFIKEPIQENKRSSDRLESQLSVENSVAEKHESEKCEKEIFQMDITYSNAEEHIFTQNQKVTDFEEKEECKNKRIAAKTPDTPASTSSKTSSSSTEQGKEYNIDDAEVKILRKKEFSEEKGVSETKDGKELLDSPSSDSFEMIDQPDISDEYVIIEEVGREAQENDQEGKSISISNATKKMPKRLKKEKEEKNTAEFFQEPIPKKELTDNLKYLTSDENADLFSLEFESSSQPFTKQFVEKPKRKYDNEERVDIDYEEKIEQSKKWVEMQFQGEQPAKIISDYGYEMDFERAPLEDIKEEDINELEGSSKIGSMGSQKESLGSFSSVKDSFSSTPDFDVLAGRKYFTKSGEHDDVSMSSLQEFELIEKKIMESGKKSGSSSSQDSLSSKKLGTSSKSGQGDDPSTSSLKEFENLENACATVVKMESRAKQEEAILSEIDEGHESQISESESCETVSAVIKEKLESDSEDFDKRMLEIDEIIRQAQTNVDKFSDLQAFEKIESMGRGDSFEEVAKVPDLELDTPLSNRQTQNFCNPKLLETPQIVSKKNSSQWESRPEKLEQFSLQTSNLPFSKKQKSSLLENGWKGKSISVDCLELKAKDQSMVVAEEMEDAVSLDSYKENPQKFNPYKFTELFCKSDSNKEKSEFWKYEKSSSGNCSSSGKEETGTYKAPPKNQLPFGSTDSLDPSSSACTQATYQCETDSMMSSSITSVGSNTLISSSDNLDLQSALDFSKEDKIIKSDNRLENTKKINVKPVIAFKEDEKSSDYSRAIISPEIQKVAFRAPFAEKALDEYLENLGPNEEIVETEEVDEHGNIHRKKILLQKAIIRSNDPEYEKLEKKRNEAEMIFEYEKSHVRNCEPFISETVEPLVEDEFSHIVHKKIQLVPEVEKISIKGLHAEEILQKYIASTSSGEEIKEIEEIDESGNIHLKKMVIHKTVMSPRNVESKEPLEKTPIVDNDAKNVFTESEKTAVSNFKVAESGKLCLQESASASEITNENVMIHKINEKELDTGKIQKPILQNIVQIEPDLKKITFEGPDAKKKLEDYIKHFSTEDEIVELEEMDEFGNIHKKKLLKKKVVVKPQTFDFSKESRSSVKDLYVTATKLPEEIEKVTFTGPYAGTQLQQFVERLEPEKLEEIQEADKEGNIHLIKIVKQKKVVQPKDFEKLLESQNPKMTTEVQKVVFKGSHADQELQKYIQNLGINEEIKEIEEEDEDGNIHVRKVLKQRVIIRPEELGDTDLTKEELEKFLKARSKKTSLSYEITEPFVSEIIEPLNKEEFITNQKLLKTTEELKLSFQGFEKDETVNTKKSNLGITTTNNCKTKSENVLKTSVSEDGFKKSLKLQEEETFGVPSTKFVDPNTSTNFSLTEALTSSIKLTEKGEQSKSDKEALELRPSIKKESGISKKPPLISDISMDDEAEYDTTEHDWRHQLEILHAEAEEEEEETNQKLDAALK